MKSPEEKALLKTLKKTFKAYSNGKALRTIKKSW